MTFHERYDQPVRHFGTVTASLSHELGNALASALETAGLISDWVFAAAEGQSLDPERIGSTVQRIERAVNRGLDQVQLLNWIAHSIDQTEGAPRLETVVERAVASANYFARQRNVRLDIAADRVEATIPGPAFDLHLLVFSCLRLAIDSAADGASVVTRPASDEDGHRVDFEVTALREDAPDDTAGRALVASLATSSGCRLEPPSPDHAGRFRLRLSGGPG